MNVYVLRIGNSVEGVYKSIDELYKDVEGFVKDDFDWRYFKYFLTMDYDFGRGIEEEIEVSTFVV